MLFSHLLIFQHIYFIKIEEDNTFDFHVHLAFRIQEFGFLNDSSSSVWSRRNIFDISQLIENSILQIFSEQTGSGRLIGIAIEKSALYVAAVIGILRSGNAFISLDPPTLNCKKSAGQLSAYTIEKCARFNVPLIISVNVLELLPENWKVILEKNFSRNKNFFFAKKLNKCKKLFFDWMKNDERIMYAIQTSGSTGEPKTVHVPARAIMPNVVDFVKRFGLNESDRILFSTSLFFDPSIIEMFCAMYCGAELIVLSTFLTSKSTLFEHTILSNQPLSFVQLTPAVLQRFSADFLRLVFSAKSPIRNLLIGGEVFPWNLVRFFSADNCSTNVFNIYGVTEVSCWASCRKLEILKDTVNILKTSETAENLIDIGEPLLNTFLKVNSDEGNLLISGSRKCYIDFNFDKNVSDDFILTGDLAFEKLDEKTGKMRIFVRGRNKKPNGILPFSAEIEEIYLKNFEQILFTKLLFINDCRFLFLNFSQTKLSADLQCAYQSEINEFTLNETKLPKRLRPTRIFYNIELENFLSKNDKVDEKKLTKFVRLNLRDNFIGSSSSAFCLLCKMYPSLKGFELSTELLELPLRCLGIGSLEIAELAFLLEENFQDADLSVVAPNATQLIQILLDERQTKLKNLLELIDNCLLKNSDTNLECISKTQKRNCQDNDLLSLRFKPTRFCVKEVWCADLKKCVDATPIRVDCPIDSKINDLKSSSSLIYVGSHAGKFRAFDFVSGNVLLEFDEAFSAAIEAKCAVGNQFIAFGTLSGKIYVFERHSHKYCDVLQCGKEIRASPVIFSFKNDEKNCVAEDSKIISLIEKTKEENTEIIFCGSYDGNLYAFQINSKTKKIESDSVKKFDVSASQSRFGLIRSAPFVSSLYRNGSRQIGIVVATLAGYVISFEYSNSRRWCLKVDSPVFADICQLPSNSTLVGHDLETIIIVVVTVRGTVTLFDFENGEQKCQLSLNATIFDSPSFYCNKSNSFQELSSSILLLCHNEKIFVIKECFDPISRSIKLSFLKTLIILDAEFVEGINGDSATKFFTVKSPLILGCFAFVLTNFGSLIRFNISDVLQALSSTKSDADLFYETVFRLNEPTFGLPVIEAENCSITSNCCTSLDSVNNSYRILLGSRANFVRCFVVGSPNS